VLQASDFISAYSQEIRGYGSVVRFVYSIGGRSVSALLVTMAQGGPPTVTDVYTAPAHRGLGYATALLAEARRLYPDLTISTDRSAAGRAWVAAVAPHES